MSVVIPLYNAERHVAALLDSLQAQEWSGSWEVIVADNGSTDSGPEIVESYGGQISGLRLIDASRIRGSAYARNAGAEHAAGSALAFVDNDDVLGEGYVAAIGEALRHRAFVCGRWDVHELNPEWARALRPSGQWDGPMMWNYNFLPYAAGGTLGIRRELFDAVGGFDEAVHYSDCTDFCWRVQLSTPAELQMVPEAVVHYRYRESLREQFSQARNWGRAEVGIYRRYRPLGVQRIPLRESLRRWTFVYHLKRLRHRAGRAWWAVELGNRIGRIEGSLRERTILL